MPFFSFPLPNGTVVQTSQPLTGVLPSRNVNNSLSSITPVIHDSLHIGASFGDVMSQPKTAYSIGDVVNATFVASDPRNNAT
jgi:neutral ceramidase